MENKKYRMLETIQIISDLDVYFNDDIEEDETNEEKMLRKYLKNYPNKPVLLCRPEMQPLF